MEFGIKNNPASSRSSQANEAIEIIHQALGNLVRKYNLHEKYTDDADQWMRILGADAFA